MQNVQWDDHCRGTGKTCEMFSKHNVSKIYSCISDLWKKHTHTQTNPQVDTQALAEMELKIWQMIVEGKADIFPDSDQATLLFFFFFEGK